MLKLIAQKDYEYDSRNNLVKKTTIESSNNTIIEKFEYNEQNLCIKHKKITKENYRRRRGFTKREITYKYDNKGRCIKKEDHYKNYLIDDDNVLVKDTDREKITNWYFNGGHDKYGRETFIEHSIYNNKSTESFKKIYKTINKDGIEVERVINERHKYKRFSQEGYKVYWDKRIFDKEDRQIYHKDQDGYLLKRIYDENGNKIYEREINKYNVEIIEKFIYDNKTNELLKSMQLIKKRNNYNKVTSSIIELIKYKKGAISKQTIEKRKELDVKRNLYRVEEKASTCLYNLYSDKSIKLREIVEANEYIEKAEDAEAEFYN